MEDSALYHYRKFWGGVALCILLVALLGACDTNSQATTTHSTSTCTTLSAKSGTNSAVMATIPLPGHPFKAIASSNGQWLFVSIDSQSAASNGIAILHKQGAQICLQRVIPLSGTPLGLILTKSEHMLLVANSTNIAFIDVALAEKGAQGAVLGYVQEHSSSSTVDVILSQNERYGFAANENDGTVSVIDFSRILAHDFSTKALIGQITLGTAPVGMAVSLDDRYLYILTGNKTGASSTQNAAAPCSSSSQGALEVADITRVNQDAAHAVVAKIAAGCDPARLLLASDSATIWVAARGDNKVLAFNTAMLLTNPASALLATVDVGPAPIGLALVQSDDVLIVANSNGFQQPQQPQTLTVLGVRSVIEGKPAVLSTIKVGAFPRELTLEADAQTVLLTNFNSNTLLIIDSAKLPGPKK